MSVIGADFVESKPFVKADGLAGLQNFETDRDVLFFSTRLDLFQQLRPDSLPLVLRQQDQFMDFDNIRFFFDTAVPYRFTVAQNNLKVWLIPRLSKEDGLSVVVPRSKLPDDNITVGFPVNAASEICVCIRCRLERNSL